MNQPVHTFSESNEDPKIGDRLHLSRYPDARRISFCNEVPGIGFDLFHPQGDPAFHRIAIKSHYFQKVADVDDFGRMFHLFAPGHFRNMNQSFDSLLKFDEDDIISDIDHFPLNARSHRIILQSEIPWVREDLLQSQRNLLLLLIEVENLHPDPLPHRDPLRWMSDPSPADVRNVEKAINPSSID